MAQTYDEFLRELDAAPKGVMASIERPPEPQQATAAPRATGVSEYYANRAIRSALGEGTTSLLGMVLPKSIGEPLQTGVRSAMSSLGFPEMAPPGEGSLGRSQRQFGNIVAGITDPMTLAPIGKAGTMLRMAEGGLGATGAEAVGSLGQAIGGQTGQVVGGLVGGALGGTVPQKIGVAKDVVQGGVGRIKSAIKQGQTGEVPQAAKEAVEKVASGYVTNIMKAAQAADPNFLGKIQQSMNEAGQAGVNMPILNLVSNPIVKQEVENLLSRYPSFRANYEKMWNDAKALVEKKASMEYGTPQTAARVKAIGDITSAQKKVARKLSTFDSSIAKISDAYNVSPDNQKLGARLNSLIDAKEKTAMEQAAPAYNDAFKYAEDNALKMPNIEVEKLYTYVKDEKYADIFKTFPALYRKVENVFKPVVGEGLDFNPQTFEITRKTTQEFGAKEIQDLDSLKRELNKVIRTTKDENNLRILTDFKQQVQGSIDAVDPVFAEKYKAADAQYRATVGIPFNSETAKMIDRAKFDENIVPLITRNKSMLQEMLQATGKDGLPIAEAAFMSDFGKYAVVNGVLNTTKANKWLKDNATEISLVPGLKDKIMDSRNAIANIEASKAALNANFARAKAADILGKEGMTVKQIVDKSTSDPAFLTAFMNKHGKNTETLSAIRSFALDDLLSYKNPMDALDDKVKGAFYNRVFEGRLDRVKQLANVSRMLGEFSPDDIGMVIKNSVPKDALEKATSLPANTAFSVIRDRIMSPIQKVFVLTNKAMTGLSARRQDELLQEILIDPKKVEQLAKASQKIVDGDMLTADEAKGFLVNMLRLAEKYVVPGEGAVRGAVVGAEGQSVQSIQQEKQVETYDEFMSKLNETNPKP
jgi:hypothetical protein